MSQTYLSKMVAGKKTQADGKQVIKCLVLCNLSHSALFPLINYQISKIDIFMEFMQDSYSNYSSFIRFNAEKIIAYGPDLILIIHDESYYLDEFGICFPINKVKDNIASLNDELEHLIEILHVKETKTKVITTSLPYDKKSLQHYISLEERTEVIAAINSFVVSKNNHPTISHSIDIGDFAAGYVENIYNEHNTLASLALMDKVAIELVKILRLQTGKAIKCIITDLDNTFWDGVAADDGIEHILSSKRKKEFLMYQRWLARMHEQGIILAIVSKNNREFIEMLFAKAASEFQVGWEQFSAKQINWHPKSQNIYQICSELNINPEHVLFIDDSRYECEEIRAHVAGITLFEFSPSIKENVEALTEKEFFIKERVTHSDTIRSQTYAQNALRNSQALLSESNDEFLNQLNMVLSYTKASEPVFGRISELTLRTNQFNMTMLRMDIKAVRNFTQQPGNTVLVYSCRDHYGDLGIIGSAFININHLTCTVENIVMSCRVFGRYVEHAILDTIVHFAHKNGCQFVDGSFNETLKNANFKTFYQEHGFFASSSTQNQLNLTNGHLSLTKNYVTIEEIISEH